MLRFITARLSTAALAALALTAHADTLDQSNAPTNAGFNSNAASLSWQQQVVTGMAGVLTRVELFTTGLEHAPLQDFRVSINKGLGWQTDADDFSVVVTPVEGVFSVNVASANLSFAVGDAFMIGVSGLGPNGDCCVLQGSAFLPGYGAGELFLNGSVYNGGGYDIAFNTYVNAVPEPVSALLMAVGLLGVAAAVRRRD